MMRRFRGVCQMDSEKTFSESENVMVQVSFTLCRFPCPPETEHNYRSAAEVTQFAVLGGLSFFCEMHWVTWRKIEIAKLAKL